MAEGKLGGIGNQSRCLVISYLREFGGLWSSGAECGGADFYDYERRVVTKTRDPGRAKLSRNLKDVAEVAQNL